MNDPQEPLPDELLDEMLAPLRAVAVPDETHVSNVAAVRRALARRVRPPWWRRTVPVPIPVAIAATLALAFTATALLRPALGPKRTDREARQTTQTESVGTDAAPDLSAGYVTKPVWSVSLSYIRSLGSPAMLRLPFTSDVMEQRDDS